MDSIEPKEALLSFCRHNILSIVLFVSGLILLVYGFFILFPAEKQAIRFETSHVVQDEAEKKESAQTIVVDVAGAVLKPGVYTLHGKSRIGAAITKAGGFAEKADKEAIAKKINLASLLTDGQKLYIPFQGEETQESGEEGISQQGLININTATEGTLDTLTGVGPVTAQKIISNRPYQNIQELVSKKSVSTKVFEQIKDLITVL